MPLPDHLRLLLSPRPLAGALALALAILAIGCDRGKGADNGIETFAVRKGALEITILESGNLEAIDSQSIVNQVSRSMKIAEIVDEGSIISEEDVAAKKTLVRFETNDLDEDKYSRESDLESARSSLTEAQEALLIQKSENETSVREAELAVTYARNDLRKLVGEKLAERVIAKEPEDIRSLLEDPELGGQTRQDLDKYQGDIEIARTKLGRAQEKLKFTEDLFAKQYVSKNELDTDRLDLQSQVLAVQTAESKLDIYRLYEFVQSFQKSWATLLSAREKQERTEAIARSRTAQAEARLRGREAAFRRAEVRLQELVKDIENSTIRATQPGFVVYETPPRWQNTGPLQAGSELRPRQAIIQLPDLNVMGVNVKIHEAQIDQIQLGQTASVTIDAIPGRTFSGKVTKKALLPSSQSSWLNPDLKVYETLVTLDGRNEDHILRPGMTATVEIFVDRIEDVLRVPIQSIQTDENGAHSCCRRDGERVRVEIGKRNQVFVEILKGLEEGDEILMTPPELADRKEDGQEAP